MHAFSTQSPFECFGVKTLPWPTPSQHGLTRISVLSLVINGKDWFFDCATAKEKRDLYGALYRHLQGMKTEDELRQMVRDLAARHRVDIASFCRDLCMD